MLAIVPTVVGAAALIVVPVGRVIVAVDGTSAKRLAGSEVGSGFSDNSRVVKLVKPAKIPDGKVDNWLLSNTNGSID